MKQTFFLTICFIFLLNGTLPAQTRADGTPIVKGAPRIPTKKTRESQIPPELKEKLKVTEAEKIEFKEILKNSRGKIAKIWNSPCKYEKVVDVGDAKCWEQLAFTPASNFAFPDEDSFAGFSLIEGEFWAGRYGPIHSLIVDLGEVDFRKINKETKEVRILNGFPLAYNAQDRKIETISGIHELQGLKISDKQPAKLNHAYLLRSVMFSNNHIFTQNGRFTQNQRIETVHAIRVVKDKDNVVTILWKKIDAKRSSVN